MKVSIIITSYNVDKYIRKCLDSLVGQTLKDVEFIVVDDGSTDGTKEIIREFAEKDNRIKTIFFKENTIGGVAKAANAGIEAAIGEYIGFADGDDWYEEKMFETLYTVAAENDADIAICNYLEYDESGRSYNHPADFSRWDPKWPSNRPLTGVENKKKLLRFVSVPWRKLYRRSLIMDMKVRFPEGDFFYEDNPFHWQCITLADRFAAVNKVLCYHRTSRDGQTMSANDKRLFAMYQHFRIIHDWLNEKDLLFLYRETLIEWLIGNTEWISRQISDDHLENLFSLFRESILIDGKPVARKTFEAITVGHRGRMIAKVAIDNDKQLFHKAVKDQLKEGLFQKIKRFYTEKGLAGLLSTALASLVYRSGKIFKRKWTLKIPFSKKDSNTKVLEELAAIRKELRVLRGAMFYLTPDMAMKNDADDPEKGSPVDKN